METWREELYHSAKGTSWEKTDHKYIERKKVNGKWVYRYTSDAGGVYDSETLSGIKGTQHNAREAAKTLTEMQKDGANNSKAINSYANEARHEGEKATKLKLEAQYGPGAEKKYREEHPIDYYKNKGEAFIERLLKKK